MPILHSHYGRWAYDMKNNKLSSKHVDLSYCDKAGDLFPVVGTGSGGH